MVKLRLIWIALHSSLWFTPSLIVIAAVLLAFGMVEVDTRLSGQLADQYPRLLGAGAESARNMLSTIAGSMITVAGVTFSITIVALSLAASQYTPRILRNFMRDPVTQTVLGVFVGIFTYCIIVMRTIRGGDETAFVPPLSVLLSVVLALVGIGFLILFIHHIADSIRASTLVALTSDQTLAAIDRLFPEQLCDVEPEQNDSDLEQEPAGLEWRAIPALNTGYIETVDADSVLRFAVDRQIRVRMERSVGEFVVERSLLASISGNEVLDKETISRLNSFYSISRSRTVEQDAAFGVRQLVDIALKALSPGVNETTTAIICLDYLSAILARLADRRIDPPHRFDGNEMRLIGKGPTFEDLVDEAFNQIRQNAAGNVGIIIRMLKATETTANFTVHPKRRLVLTKHVELIAELAERTVESMHDRSKIKAYLVHVRTALTEQPRC